MVDKRQHMRVSVRVPVLCERPGASVISGLVTDLSLGGLRIASPEVPGFGTHLTIVAHMPGDLEACRLPATVRWTKPTCFGVEFGMLSAKDVYRIVDLMAHSVRSSARPMQKP